MVLGQRINQMSDSKRIVLIANDYIYDIEVYPNVFTMAIKSVRTKKRRTYEISPRKNELGPIIAFLERLKSRGARMVGFNNFFYDYPVLHYLFEALNGFNEAIVITEKLYAKSSEIIDTDFNNRYRHTVKEWKQVVKQVDLVRIHHFDNINKLTSLKILEFNMRMTNIRDLPFKPGTYLTIEEIGVLVDYNDHDVDATFDFYMESLDAINFREVLSVKYNRDFINHNDTKIGKDYFIMQLEQKMGITACYHKVDGKRKPKQTKREQIALKDIIFDYVEFKTEPFKAVKQWIENQVITETKGVFTELPLEDMISFIEYSKIAREKRLIPWINSGFLNKTPKFRKKDRRLSVELDDVEFVFGLGGIHASIKNQLIKSDEEYVIIDLDVTSYYPSIAISNRVFPEHLSEKFCDIYDDMKQQRMKYAKGSSENKMLKLALNGVYGDSNQKFSPFYDPQYTMTITVNGQLLLCMLYEQLREIPNLKLIQVNTDGLTVKVERSRVDEVFQCKRDWEKMTGLDLEDAVYEYMFIRDVNNYIAKFEGEEKIKRKGAYEYELDWNQNFSSLVIPRAVEAYVTQGADIRDFIENHQDDHDFALRTKVPRSSRLIGEWGHGIDETFQNTSRYYIAKEGPELVKVMPPLPKNPDKERHIGINIDCCVHECNHFEGIDRNLIDFDWYVNEAEKLSIFKGDNYEK